MALKRQTDKLLTCQPTAFPGAIDIMKGYKIVISKNHKILLNIKLLSQITLLTLTFQMLRIQAAVT